MFLTLIVVLMAHRAAVFIRHTSESLGKGILAPVNEISVIIENYVFVNEGRQVSVFV